MDSSLPTSLKYVISNVEYYGPVLFMAGMTLLFKQTQSCFSSNTRKKICMHIRGFLTKHELKITGFLPSSFLDTLLIKDLLLYGIKNTVILNQVISNGEDGCII